MNVDLKLIEGILGMKQTLRENQDAIPISQWGPKTNKQTNKKRHKPTHIKPKYFLWIFSPFDGS